MLGAATVFCGVLHVVIEWAIGDYQNEIPVVNLDE